jgi:putative ABC transport system substrate-binding protein
VKGFRQGLLDLGYVEGKNIIVTYRFGEGSESGLKDLAAELVGLPADVLVAIGPPSVFALRDTGTMIPIVAMTGDLVGNGLVASMGHPGGTITGISFMFNSRNLTGKRLQYLREVLPALTQVGLLFNPTQSDDDRSEVERAAPTYHLIVHTYPVQVIEEVKPAIARVKNDGVQAILVAPSTLLIAYQQQIAELALEFRLPAASEQPEFAEAGGLLSYGPSVFATGQRQAWYVDQILKGKKPADLPVEAPDKFDFVINVRTAKALGVAVPPSLLAQADKVIE